MIETFFLICAVVGGTILVIQAVLSLMGLGLGEVAEVGDVPDVPDADLPIDGATGHLDGQWHLAKLLSLQAILAFFTFFGIGGLSALESGATPGAAAAVAFAVGLVAMIALAWFLGQLRRLQSDGTVRLADAVGTCGRVYLSVPGQDGGVGKVTLVLQGRTLEVEARTPGPDLRSGEEVVVARVLDQRTVEVVSPSSHLVKPVPLQ